MDRVLVERAMTGDRGAFKQLARRSIARLYAVARLILRDHDRAGGPGSPEDGSARACIVVAQLGGPNVVVDAPGSSGLVARWHPHLQLRPGPERHVQRAHRDRSNRAPGSTPGRGKHRQRQLAAPALRPT